MRNCRPSASSRGIRERSSPARFFRGSAGSAVFFEGVLAPCVAALGRAGGFFLAPGAGFGVLDMASLQKFTLFSITVIRIILKEKINKIEKRLVDLKIKVYTMR
jgi:hypothetical protein